MTSSARTPIDRTGGAERLRQARLRVLAGIGAGDRVPGTVVSPTPVRVLPEDLLARLQARSDAGLAELGHDFPGRARLVRVAVPAALVGVLAVVGVVVALATGRPLVAVLALVVLAAAAVVAAVGARRALADPLRLTDADRAEVLAAGTWTPSPDWSTARAGTEAAALLALAVEAVQRVVRCDAWRCGILARSGVVLMPGPELDRIEAALRRPGDADVWPGLIVRVAVLTVYADTVEPFDLADDALPQDDVEVLAYLLSARIHEPG